jgi:hypothetical protein
MEDGYFFLHYLGVLLYVSCVLGLRPFAPFNIHYIIKKKKLYGRWFRLVLWGVFE